jgi:hypothetical protein
VGWWPVVQRELLVTAKGSRLLWMRIVPAFLATTIGWLFLLLSGAPTSTHGPSLFGLIAALLLLYVFLAGLVRSVDSISSERRGGTLQLLGLPGLSASDIVIGKLASASLEILSGLAAVLPVLWIPIMLGGVTGAQVLRTIWAVIGTLALSTSIGFFASSRATAQDESMRKAFAWLAGSLVLGSGVLLFFFRKGKNERHFKRWILLEVCVLLATFAGVLHFHYNLGSPVVPIETFFEGSSAMDPWSFPVGIVFLFLLSGVFLLRACGFKLSALPEDAIDVRTAVRSSRKSDAIRKRKPLLWLGSHGRRSWGPLLVASISFLILIVLRSSSQFWGGMQVLTLLIVVPWLLLPFYLAHAAAQLLESWREQGMLELLTIAGFSWDDLLRAQKQIFLRQIWLPLCLWAMAALWPLFEIINLAGVDLSPWIASISLQAANLCLYIWATFWPAVCFVSRGKKALVASSLAVALDLGTDLLSWVLQFAWIRFFPGPSVWLFSSPATHTVCYFAIIILTRRATLPPGETEHRPKRSLGHASVGSCHGLCFSEVEGRGPTTFQPPTAVYLRIPFDQTNRAKK